MSRSDPFTPAVRRFLETPGRFAVLSVLDEGGSPHQAVVWYAVRGATILVNAQATRRWAALLRRDPRISLLVFDGYVHVNLRGRAELVAEGDAALADIQALARSYGKDPGLYAGTARLSFTVRPERVWVHGELD